MGGKGQGAKRFFRIRGVVLEVREADHTSFGIEQGTAENDMQGAVFQVGT